MKLVGHRFHKQNGQSKLSIFPVPTSFLLDGKETRIDCRFSWGLKQYKAKHHPMQLVVFPNGIVSGEIQEKSFGMKVVGFAEQNGLREIDYTKGKWSRNKHDNAVQYVEDGFGIEYRLAGLNLKQTIRITDKKYLLPIYEKMYLNADEYKVVKSGRVRIETRSETVEEVQSPIYITENDTIVGQFAPGVIYNKDHSLPLVYELFTSSNGVYLVTKIPQEAMGWETPIYIDPTTLFGWTKNLGVCRRTIGINTVYLDHQHQNVDQEAGSAWDDVEAQVYWSASNSPDVNQNGILYADLYIPNEYKAVITEVSKIDLKVRTHAISGSGDINATLLPIRIRPLDGTQVSSAFTPDFTLQRIGISPTVLFGVVNNMSTLHAAKTYPMSTMTIGGGELNCTLFDKSTSTNGRIAEIFNDMVNSDREPRFTAIVFANTAGSRTFSASSTNPVEFTLTWGSVDDNSMQPRALGYKMPQAEPAISFASSPSGIGYFDTAMGVCTRDFYTSSSETPNALDPYRLDQRASVKDEYAYFDPHHRIFNHVPNPYMFRNLDGVFQAGVSITSTNTDCPDFISDNPRLRTIKITCNANVTSSQANVHNTYSTTNRHCVLIPLHSMEFMQQYVARFWAKSDGVGWHGLVIHGYDFENNKWAATKLEDDGGVDVSSTWRHLTVPFKPAYTTSWSHSRCPATDFGNIPEHVGVRTWNVSHANQSLFGTKYPPYSSFLLFYSNTSATTGSLYLHGLSVFRLHDSIITDLPIECMLNEIDASLDGDVYNSILERKNRIFQIPFRGSTATDAITPRKTLSSTAQPSPTLGSASVNLLGLPYLPDSSTFVYFNAEQGGAVGYDIPEDPLDEGEIEFYYCPAYQIASRSTKNIVLGGKRNSEGFLIRDAQNSNDMENTFELAAGSRTYVFDNMPRHIFSLGNIAAYASGNANLDRDPLAGAGMTMTRHENSLVWQIRDPGHVWKDGSLNNPNSQFGMTNNMAGSNSRDKAVYSCQFDIPESMITGSTAPFITSDGNVDIASWMHIRLSWGDRMEMYVNGQLVDTNPHTGFVSIAPMPERATALEGQTRYNNARNGLMNRLHFGNYALSYKTGSLEPIGGVDLRHSAYNSSRAFNYVCQGDDCIIQEFGISKKPSSSVFPASRSDYHNEIGSYNNNEVVSSASASGHAPSYVATSVPIADISRTTNQGLVEYEIESSLFNTFNPGGNLHLMGITNTGTRLYFKMRRFVKSGSPTLYRAIVHYTDSNWKPTALVGTADTELSGVSSIDFFEPNSILAYNGYVPENDKYIWLMRGDGKQAYVKSVTSRSYSGSGSFVDAGNGQAYPVEGIDQTHALIRAGRNSNIFASYPENILNGYELSFASNGSGARIVRDWKVLQNGNILVTFDTAATTISLATRSIYIRQASWTCILSIISNDLFGLVFDRVNGTVSNLNDVVSVYSSSLVDKGVVQFASNQGNGYVCNRKLKLASPYPIPTGSTTGGLFTTSPYLCQVWYDGYWHIALSGSTNNLGVRITKAPFANPTSSDITIVEDRSSRFSIEGSGEWVLRAGGHLVFKSAPEFVFQLTRIWFGGTGATDSMTLCFDGKQVSMPANDSSTTRFKFRTPYPIVACADRNSICFESEFNNEIAYRMYDMPSESRKWIIEGMTRSIDHGANVSIPYNMEYGDFGVVIPYTTEAPALGDYYARRNVTDGGTTESYSLISAGGIYLAMHVSEQYAGTRLTGGHLYPNLFPLYSVIHGLNRNLLLSTWYGTKPDFASNVVLRNSDRWCRFPFHYFITKKLYGFVDDGTEYSDLNKERYLKIVGCARGAALTASNQRGLLRVKLRMSACRYLQSDLTSDSQLQSTDNAIRMSVVGEPITCKVFGARSSMLSSIGSNTYGQPSFDPCPKLWFDGRYWNLKQSGTNISNYTGVAGAAYPTLGGFLFRAIYGFDWNLTSAFSSSTPRNLSDLFILGEGFEFSGTKNRHPTCRLDLKSSGSSNITGLGASYNNLNMIVHPDVVSNNMPAAIGGAGFIQTESSISDSGVYRIFNLHPRLPYNNVLEPWQDLVGHIAFRIDSPRLSGSVNGVGIYQPHVAESDPSDINPRGWFLSKRLIIGRDGYFKVIDGATGSLAPLVGDPTPTATISPNPGNSDLDNRVYYNNVMTSSTRHVRVMQPISYQVRWDIANDIFPKNERNVLFIGNGLSGRRCLSFHTGSPMWQSRSMLDIRIEYGYDTSIGSIRFGNQNSHDRKRDEEHDVKSIYHYMNSYASPIFRQNRMLGANDGMYSVKDGGTYALRVSTTTRAIVSTGSLVAVSDDFAPASSYNRVCLGQTRDLQLSLTNIGSENKTYLAGQACLIWRDQYDNVLFYKTNDDEVTISSGGGIGILEFSDFEFATGEYSNPALEGAAKMELQYPATEPIEDAEEVIILDNKLYVQRHPYGSIGLYLPNAPIDARHRVFYITGDTYAGVTKEDNIRTDPSFAGDFYTMYSRGGLLFNLPEKNFLERTAGDYTRLQKYVTNGHPNPRFSIRIAYASNSIGMIGAGIPLTASIDQVFTGYEETRLETEDRTYDIIDFYPTYNTDNIAAVSTPGDFSSAHKFARVTAKGLRDGFTDHSGGEFRLFLKGFVNGKLETVECTTDVVTSAPLYTMITQEQPEISLYDWNMKSPNDQDGDQYDGNVLISEGTNATFDVRLATESGSVSSLRPRALFAALTPTTLTVNEFANTDYESEKDSPPSVINVNSGGISTYGSWLAGGTAFTHSFTGYYNAISNEGVKTWYYHMPAHASDLYNRDSNGAPYFHDRSLGDTPTLIVYGPPTISGAYAIQDDRSSGIIKVGFSISTPGANAESEVLIGSKSANTGPDGNNYDRVWIASGVANTGSGFQDMPIWTGSIAFPIVSVGDLDVTPIAAQNLPATTEYQDDGRYDSSIQNTRHFKVNTGNTPVDIVLSTNLKHNARHVFGSRNIFDGYTYENMPQFANAPWTFYIRARRPSPLGGAYLYTEQPVSFTYMCADPTGVNPISGVQNFASTSIVLNSLEASSVGTANIIDALPSGGKQYSFDGISWTNISSFPLGTTLPAENLGWNSIYFKAKDYYENFTIACMPRPYDTDNPSQDAMIALPQYGISSKYALDIHSGDQYVYVNFPNFEELTPYKWVLEYSRNGGSYSDTTWHTYSSGVQMSVFPIFKHVNMSSNAIVWHTFYENPATSTKNPATSMFGWTPFLVNGTSISQTMEIENCLGINDGTSTFKTMNLTTNASEFYIASTSTDIVYKSMYAGSTPINYLYLTMNFPAGKAANKVAGTQPNGRMTIKWKNEGDDTLHSKDVGIYDDGIWHSYAFDMSDHASWITQRKTVIQLYFTLNNGDANTEAPQQTNTIKITHFGLAGREGLTDTLVPMRLGDILDGETYINFRSRLVDWKGDSHTVSDSNTYYVLPITPTSVDIVHARSNDGLLRAKVNSVSTTETGSGVEYRVRYRKNTSTVYEYMDNGAWHTIDDWESGIFMSQELDEGVLYLFSIQARNPNSTSRMTPFSSDTSFFSDYITPQVEWTSHFSDVHWLYQSDKNADPVPNIVGAALTPQAQGAWQNTYAWKKNEYGQFFKSDWNHGFYHYNDTYLSDSTDHSVQCNIRNIINGMGADSELMTTHPVDGFFYRLTYTEDTRDTTIVDEDDSFIEGTLSVDRYIGILHASFAPDNGSNAGYRRNIAYVHIRPYYKVGLDRIPFDKKYQVHLAFYLDYDDGLHPVPTRLYDSYANGINIDWDSNSLPAALSSGIYTIGATVNGVLGISVVDERPQWMRYSLLAREVGTAIYVSGAFSDYHNYLAVSDKYPDEITSGGLKEHTLYAMNYVVQNSAGIIGPKLVDEDSFTWTMIRPADSIVNVYPSGTHTIFRWSGLENERALNSLEVYLPLNTDGRDDSGNDRHFNVQKAYRTSGGDGGCMLFNSDESIMFRNDAGYSNLDKYAISFKCMMRYDNPGGNALYAETNEFTASNKSMFMIGVSDDARYVNVMRYSASGTMELNVVGGTRIDDEEMHAITWTDLDGEYMLYIDGIPEASGSYVKTPIQANVVSIGAAKRDGIVQSTRGAMDELRIYSGELSHHEISEIFHDTAASIGNRQGYYEIFDWMNGESIATRKFEGLQEYELAAQIEGGRQCGFILKAYNHDGVTFPDYAENKSWNKKPVRRSVFDAYSWKPVIYDFMTGLIERPPTIFIGYDAGSNNKYLKAVPVRNLNQDEMNRKMYTQWSAASPPYSMERIIDEDILGMHSNTTIRHNQTQYLIEAYERSGGVETRLGFVNGSGTVSLNYAENLWHTMNAIRVNDHKSLVGGLDPNKEYGFRVMARNSNGFVLSDVADNFYRISDWSEIAWSNIYVKSDDDYDKNLHIYSRNAGPNPFESAYVVQDIVGNFNALKDFRLSFKILGSETTDFDKLPSTYRTWIQENLDSIPESAARIIVDVKTQDRTIRRTLDLWRSTYKNGMNPQDWGVHDSPNVSVHDTYGEVDFSMHSDHFGNLSEQEEDKWYFLKWNLHEDVLNGSSQSSGDSLSSYNLSWSDVTNVRIYIVSISFYIEGIYDEEDVVNTWRNTEFASDLEKGQCGILIRDCSIGWTQQVDEYGAVVNDENAWNGEYEWAVQPKNVKMRKEYVEYRNMLEEGDIMASETPRKFIERRTLTQPSSTFIYDRYVKEVMD